MKQNGMQRFCSLSGKTNVFERNNTTSFAFLKFLLNCVYIPQFRKISQEIILIFSKDKEIPRISLKMLDNIKRNLGLIFKDKQR